MVSNIITYAVKDLVDLGIIEKPLDGNHGGIHPKSSDYVEYGIPFIMASDLINGHVDIKGCKFISEEQAKSLRKGFAKEGDVLLSHKATIGRTAVVGKLSTDFIVLTPQITYYRVLDLTRLNPRYLKYYFDSEGFQALFEQWAGGGSTRLYLGITEQMKLPIELPEIKIQNKIVNLVDSFDRKITLNRQINQTLEQMAQALFKSWFVDFDPVVDNALDAGFFEQDLEFPDELLRRAEARKAARESADFKPLPEDIRQLFPAAFEECSEPSLGLGCWVPEGWKPSNVGFEFDVTMGQSPPGSTYNEIGSGLPFFQGKTDFGFRFPSNRIYCTEPKRMAKKYDTLISVRAPVGDINLAAEDCAIGRGLAAARHKSGSISFSYYVMNSLSRYFEVFEGEGTVFGSINQKDFKALPLIKYPDEIITKFDEFCGNWDKRINNLSLEISTLTDLRDTLLPKLISGELHLDEIEADLIKEGVA